MADSLSDRPPELANFLVRQGRDRIIAALRTLGTPVYGTFKLSKLLAAYEKMFKKELNNLQFFHYFEQTEFIDVVKLHLADVFDFQCPVDHIDPVLINKFGAEEEANVRLQTNVKFLGSSPYTNVQRSPGGDGKTSINFKFNKVTPHPQQPQPSPLMESPSPSRGYTVTRSPRVLTMDDRRDYYRPVSPDPDFASVNRPTPSSMRPIPFGYTTPTKLTGSNAVPLGSRFTKRIETTPSKAVPTVVNTDRIAEDVQMESTVSSTSMSVFEVVSPVNKRLTKKLPINKDQKEGGSSECDDELTDAIKPAPVPFLASSEESEPFPSDDVTPTKAVAEPKPLITTKSPNRAQAVLAQFAPKPVSTLSSFAGIRPMVLRNRNRSPSEFSVMSQQVVPFPKKKQTYTASAHRDHAVYTDDDE